MCESALTRVVLGTAPQETLSTLRYADRAKKIKNKVVKMENPTDRIIRVLKEENERLKKRIHDLESENSELKRLLADAMLDHTVLKGLLAKNS